MTIRICKCGCNESFYVSSEKSLWRYKRGHASKIIKKICKCCCGKYIVGGVKKLEKINYLPLHYQKNDVSKIKGKTWEEIYGIDGARKYREKRRKTRLGVKLNRKKPCHRKGLLYNEYYGVEKTKLIVQKIKKGRQKNGFDWTNERIIEAYLKLPLIKKSEMVKYRKQHLLPDRVTIKNHFGSLENCQEVSCPLL